MFSSAIQVLTTLSNNAVAPSTVSIPQVPLAAMTPVAATMSTSMFEFTDQNIVILTFFFVRRSTSSSISNSTTTSTTTWKVIEMWRYVIRFRQIHNLFR